MKDRVLYFSSVNWKWIKQRPHFISYYLANKGIKVDYFSITPLFKQKKAKVQNVNSNLRIMDKYVLPFSYKLKVIQEINIRYIRKVLKQEYDIIILTHPMQYIYLDDKIKRNVKIIYECMDNIPFFYEGKLKERITQIEKVVCKECDAIITSAEYLKIRIINEYNIDKQKVSTIKNAVDSSFITTPIENIELKYPNLMYIGTISEWIDYENIKRFAKENPQYTIYMIGPVTKYIEKKLLGIVNIKLIGVISHDLVKSYIASGDIMIIPFKITELIRGVDPVKMYEYLSMNKYIVSSYWDELEKYKENENVYFYDSYYSFEEQIKKIERIKRNSIEEDIQFIKINSWESRIEDYIEVLNIDLW